MGHYMRDLETKNKNQALVIEVDLFRASAAEAVRFRNILNMEIAGGYKNLVIDLTKCSFIDSAFIGAIIVIKKKLELIDGQLKIVITNKIIQNATHLTRTINVLNTFHSIHDALNNYNSSKVKVNVKTDQMCELV